MRTRQRLPVVRFAHAEPNSSSLKRTRIPHRSAASVGDDDDEEDEVSTVGVW